MRRVWAEGELPTADPSRQPKVDETPLKPSDAGFLLLDSSLRPIYANQDAVCILCYPTVPKPSKALMQAIKKRIDSLLRGHLPSLGNPSHGGISLRQKALPAAGFLPRFSCQAPSSARLCFAHRARASRTAGTGAHQQSVQSDEAGRLKPCDCCWVG